MPEGDTLFRLAGRIRERLAGQVCSSCTVRDPRLVGVDLTDATLVDAEALGKHLFVRFSLGERALSLHIHLGMDGAVHVGAVPSLPAWRRRVELRFGAGTLTAVDVPVIGLVPTADEPRLVEHLGPDVLDAGTEPALVAARLLADPAAPLAGALLDQRNAAGFGNVFAVEVPFVAGVDPHQPVGSVAGLDTLVEMGIALIRWSAAHGVRNTTGRKLHSADHWIYGKQRRPCPLCGTALRSESERSTPWRRNTVWCPACQPLAAAATADAQRIAKLLALHPALRR